VRVIVVRVVPPDWQHLEDDQPYQGEDGENAAADYQLPLPTFPS
jgi:hypothetical protein